MVAPRTFAQQEVQLSEYMFNGLTLNPALAGQHEALNMQLLYRTQWAGMMNAPMSYTGSVDGKLTQSNSMGWGLSVVGEQMGLMKTLGAYASYAFRIRLNEVGDRLSLGLSAGVAQENFSGVDFDATGNQGGSIYHPEYDDLLAPESRLRPDFRVGAYYSMGKALYAGLSASNLGSFLSSGSDTLYQNNPYIYFNLGGNIYFGEKWKLSPSLLMTYPLNDRSLLDFNVAGSYADRFWLGVGLRSTLPLGSGAYTGTQLLNSVAVMAEVWVNHAMRIGYCYDYGIGRLNGVQSGSHEVSLGITLARKVSRSVSPREAASGN
jgi:type IX secretion system PorP/SprF family membrane protein